MNLADGILFELERVRELLGDYKDIGPSGSFGAAMIEAVLKRADKAIISGDVVEILKSYGELRDCK